MFASPILTMGFALTIAVALVCFGVIRLLRYFRGEPEDNDLPQEGNYSLGRGNGAIDPEAKQP